jgi:hypothetical protein
MNIYSLQFNKVIEGIKTSQEVLFTINKTSQEMLDLNKYLFFIQPLIHSLFSIQEYWLERAFLLRILNTIPSDEDKKRFLSHIKMVGAVDDGGLYSTTTPMELDFIYSGDLCQAGSSLYKPRFYPLGTTYSMRDPQEIVSWAVLIMEYLKIKDPSLSYEKVNPIKLCTTTFTLPLKTD